MSLQRKVRIKKLNPKTALQVLIEGQIDPNEYESLTTDISSTAGVDQGESNVSPKIFRHLLPSRRSRMTKHFQLGYLSELAGHNQPPSQKSHLLDSHDEIYHLP